MKIQYKFQVWIFNATNATVRRVSQREIIHFYVVNRCARCVKTPAKPSKQNRCILYIRIKLK